MKCGSLCTGYGGLEIALTKVFPDLELTWVAEISTAACTVINERFPGVSNVGDIRHVKWLPKHRVDIISGGFPCQDVSQAGGRGGLKEGNRSGLWYEVRRAIDEIRPEIVVLENVRGLFTAKSDRTFNGNYISAMGVVLGELAQAGYDAEWRSVRASDAGLPFIGERVFILAWKNFGSSA